MAKQDSIFKVFGVTGLLCFVCSLLVCTAVVSLKSLQEQSIKVDRELSILAAADINVADGQKVSDVYAQNIEARLLDVAIFTVEDAVAAVNSSVNFVNVPAALSELLLIVLT